MNHQDRPKALEVPVPARPRTIEVPAELLAAARAVLEAHGPKRGAALLGVSRNALMGVVATGRGMPGTIALLQQKKAQQAA